jgi:small-conductance mechanosensitive channel
VPDIATTVQDRLLALIETSIIERYSGDLEKREDPRRKCAERYVPLDTDDIRELLTTLWGELVSAQTIEQVYAALVEDGAEEWPQAWCEEEIAAEREQRLSYLDYEIDRVEERLAKLIKHTKKHLAELTEEREELIGQQFDRWYAEEYHRLAD